MTSTDRAFIHAFQTAAPAPSEPATTPTVALGPTARADTPPVTPRRPLSEHLASRRGTPPRHDGPADATADETRPFQPAIRLADLAWPRAAVELAGVARSALLELIAAATSRGAAAECPSISLAATGPGVGATTATLAVAHLIGGLGGRVAVIDAGGGAAVSLGVDLTPVALDENGTAIDARSLGGRARHTTVAACDPAASGAPAIRASLSRVAREHDLVLIDAGSADSASAAAIGADPCVTTLLVDRAAGAARVRGVALARLRAAGIDTKGVVETLVG